MSWTVFDPVSANRLASQGGISPADIRVASGEPLEYALDNLQASTLLLPRKGEVLVLQIRKNQILKPSDPPREATGILGLDGDPIYLDEEPHRKSWWKRLFG